MSELQKITGLQKLKDPWLVAVWPGMGSVALTAGYYMMAKLGMHSIAEFSPRELFELEYVEVKNGLIHPGHLPRSRLFAWSDPAHQHDIVVFIGEAQPPAGKYMFCHALVDLALKLGVERVFTFAAMGTSMHPEHFSRVVGASTDDAGLQQLKALDIDVLEEGNIGGLNGVLLGVAAERGLQGSCLLGEMPHIFAQLPFPKASLAVLRVFTSLAGIDLDTHELAEQSRTMEKNLGQLLTQVEHVMERQQSAMEEESDEFPAPEVAEEEPRLDPDARLHLDHLFEEAAQDRGKAFELKQELDRLGVFQEYEDRFLDLFRKSEP